MPGFRETGQKGSELKAKKDKTKQDEYFVEGIVGKRIVHGKIKYLVKWKDWPSSTNTWEPIDHLRGSEKFVAEFEKAEKTRKALAGAGNSTTDKQIATKRSYATVVQADDSDDEADEDALVNKDILDKIPAGKVPQKIIGGTPIPPNTIALLVKWGNENEADEEDSNKDLQFIDGKVMNALHPQMVIGFYEGRTAWKEDNVQEEAALSKKN